jgi:hypothetical protein
MVGNYAAIDATLKQGDSRIHRFTGLAERLAA